MWDGVGVAATPAAEEEAWAASAATRASTNFASPTRSALSHSSTLPHAFNNSCTPYARLLKPKLSFLHCAALVQNLSKPSFCAKAFSPGYSVSPYFCHLIHCWVLRSSEAKTRQRSFNRTHSPCELCHNTFVCQAKSPFTYNRHPGVCPSA